MGNSTLTSYGGSSPSVNESSNFYFFDLKSLFIQESIFLRSGSLGMAFLISSPNTKYIKSNNPAILSYNS